MDWREFVESMSFVEQMLREDPADVYGRWISQRATATGTRSRRIAKRSRLPESEVARKAIQLAHEAQRRVRRATIRAQRMSATTSCDDGLPQLERAARRAACAAGAAGASGTPLSCSALPGRALPCLRLAVTVRPGVSSAG